MKRGLEDRKKRGVENKVCFQSLLKGKGLNTSYVEILPLVIYWTNDEAQQSWAGGKGLEPGIRTQH